MKFIILLSLIANVSFAYELREGFFHGTGEMRCNFINGKVNRPNALTWEIEKISESPLRYAILGGISTINSTPLSFTAIEKKPGKFDLINESGKRKGELNCSGDNCKLTYNFMTNFVQNIRVPQTIYAEWIWHEEGFSQIGGLKSKVVPYIINCKFKDQLIFVN